MIDYECKPYICDNKVIEILLQLVVADERFLNLYEGNENIFVFDIAFSLPFVSFERLNLYFG